MNYAHLDFVNIFYIVINMLFCGMLMAVLTPLKYSFKKTIAIFSIILTFHFIINFKIIWHLGFPDAYSFFLVSSTLTLFFTHYFLSSIRGFRFIFIFLTVCILNNLGSFLSNIIVFHLEYQIIFYAMIQFMLFFSITVIIVKVFQKSFFQVLSSINKNWGIFCILPLIFNMAFQKFNVFSYNYPHNHDYIPMNIILFILFFAIYYIIFLYFIDVSRSFELIKDNHILELQKDFQKKEYKDISTRVDSLRIYRHDMRHHFNILYALICNDNIDQAISYVDDILEDFCD